MNYYSLKEFFGRTVQGTDGDAGTLVDFLFDDSSWVCRHLVVDTGGWLTPDEVTLPMMCVVDPAFNTDDSRLRIELSRREMENQHGGAATRPVSQKRERPIESEIVAPTPAIPTDWTPRPKTPRNKMPVEDPEPARTPDLRSVREVLGDSARAVDGEIGSVADILVDTTAWQIRLLILDLHQWLPGRRVKIHCEEVLDVSWAEQHFRLSINRDLIRSRSAHDRKEAVNVGG